jgi:hypothetical protein
MEIKLRKRKLAYFPRPIIPILTVSLGLMQDLNGIRLNPAIPIIEVDIKERRE